MGKVKDTYTDAEIQHVAKRLFEAAPDIVYDEFSSFTSDRPVLDNPPDEIMHAVAQWIANCSLAERDE